MTNSFIFEGLTTVSWALSGIYFLLALYAYKKLHWLHIFTSAGLNTKKLFVMNLLLMATLRFLSFLSMAVLDLDNIDADVSAYSSTNTFFQKAELVLFDFPDFCCISAYVLLNVVWAESFLKSRRHWLSSFKFRRSWMLGYLCFNILLYSSQVVLYSFLFLPSVDQEILSDMIYIALAIYNLALPFLWSLTYLYLAIQFSGFPHSSPQAKERLTALSFLSNVWTFSRVLWGAIVLTSVLEGWLTEIEKSDTFYTIILISLFMVVEVIPIFLSLRNSALRSLSEGSEVVIRENSNFGASTVYNPVVAAGYERHKFNGQVTTPLLPQGTSDNRGPQSTAASFAVANRGGAQWSSSPPPPPLSEEQARSSGSRSFMSAQGAQDLLPMRDSFTEFSPPLHRESTITSVTSASGGQQQGKGGWLWW